MKRLMILLSLLVTLLSWNGFVQAEPTKERLFVHLKTSLKHDDAQICVAYNIIWCAFWRFRSPVLVLSDHFPA